MQISVPLASGRKSVFLCYHDKSGSAPDNAGKLRKNERKVIPMKKFLALTLAVVMSLSSVGVGQGLRNPTKVRTTPLGWGGSWGRPHTRSPYHHYGDITTSFNQTTWEAVKAFGKDNNLVQATTSPPSNDTAGRGP